MLRKLNKNEEAIQNYDKAIELSPNDVDCYCAKAYALLELGEHEQALECYDKAIELEPTCGDHYYNKGSAFRGLGKLIKKFLLAITCLFGPNCNFINNRDMKN